MAAILMSKRPTRQYAAGNLANVSHPGHMGFPTLGSSSTLVGPHSLPRYLFTGKQLEERPVWRMQSLAAGDSSH